MDITEYFDLTTKLELQISSAYDSAAALTDDLSTAKLLREIATAEIDCANSLKIGKNYVAHVPGCFGGTKFEGDELTKGQEELKDYHSQFQGRAHLLLALRRLLEIEERFEKAHRAASLVISDQRLKQLFLAITEEDQSHIGSLKNLIADLEGY